MMVVIGIYIGLLLVGNAIGMLLMGLMCASSQKSRCEECREQRAIAAMDYVARHMKGANNERPYRERGCDKGN